MQSKDDKAERRSLVKRDDEEAEYIRSGKMEMMKEIEDDEAEWI